MTRLPRVCIVLVYVAMQAPYANANEIVNAANHAIKELTSPRSWAKGIPRVAGADQKGDTLFIAIGTPLESKDGSRWQEWWQRASCLAPELRDILEAKGGIFVKIGENPTEILHDPEMEMYVSNTSCHHWFPGWGETRKSFEPSGFSVPAYQVKPVERISKKQTAPREFSAWDGVISALEVLGAPKDLLDILRLNWGNKSSK